MLKTIISIDDGHVSDMRVANLLSKYGFKGIFYIPSAQVKNTLRMSLKEINDVLVSQGHELGGHTVTHPMDLKLVEDDQLNFELINNRVMLRDMFKQDVTKFCPPRGRYDDRVIQAIKDAGYKESRTTQVLNTDLPEDPYRTHTTVHMFPREEYKGKHWFDVAKEQLDIALSKGEKGYFHLWGHSLELDRFNYWYDFESLLKIIIDKTR